MDIPDSGGQKLQQSETKEHTHKKSFSLPIPVEEKRQAPLQDNMYTRMRLSAYGLQTEKIRKADIHLTPVAGSLYPVQEYAIVRT